MIDSRGYPASVGFNPFLPSAWSTSTPSLPDPPHREGGTLRWQSITSTLAERLQEHVQARGAVLPTDRRGPATTTYIKASLQAVAAALTGHDRRTTPGRRLRAHTWRLGDVEWAIVAVLALVAAGSAVAGRAEWRHTAPAGT
ncbi:hypothetical protein GA0074692_0952 [Micromonospora pallida]|uniref:Uncharacterized protein n=1 Tax=Micromonospora pallida TaxID=145854 RepID=A0A1C6RU09_9ACTN|nr:hypothetical protein [Micromonospora pallida]SCL20695.1 hypothetical protein GA0074692_0952 [Micromonospora pallida]